MEFGFNPRTWVTRLPTFGLGHEKPKHFRDMARVWWENRDQLEYARRILHEGVCDGCALGTTGIRDYTLEGVHLCTIRLELLRLNTMGALDTSVLENVADLAELDALLALVPATEFDSSDGVLTIAEGANFNAGLGDIESSAVHNPFLTEALLTASIDAVMTEYGLPLLTDVDLGNVMWELSRGGK